MLEASKGLAERVRKITVLKLDGKLFDSAFSTKDTYIFFNSMQEGIYWLKELLSINLFS